MGFLVEQQPARDAAAAAQLGALPYHTTSFEHVSDALGQDYATYRESIEQTLVRVSSGILKSVIPGIALLFPGALRRSFPDTLRRLDPGCTSAPPPGPSPTSQNFSPRLPLPYPSP
jgi:hypothetical protein